MDSLNYIVKKLLGSGFVEFAYQLLDENGCTATGILSHATQNEQVLLWLECCQTLNTIAFDVKGIYDDTKSECRGSKAVMTALKPTIDLSSHSTIRTMLHLFKAYNKKGSNNAGDEVCCVCKECCMQKPFLERLLKIHRQSHCVSCNDKAPSTIVTLLSSHPKMFLSVYALLSEATVSFSSLMTWSDFESLNSRRRSLLSTQPKAVLSEDYLIHKQLVEQQQRVEEDTSTSIESCDDTSAASIHFVATSSTRNVFHLRLGHHIVVFILPSMTGVLAAEEAVAIINEYFKQPVNVFAELLLVLALFRDIAATVEYQANMLFGSAAFMQCAQQVQFDPQATFHLLELIREEQVLVCATSSVPLHTIKNEAFVMEMKRAISKHVQSQWRYGSDCDMSKLLPLSSHTFQAPTMMLVLPAQCSAGVNGALPMVYLNIGPAECTWILIDREQWSLMKTWLNYYKLPGRQVDDCNAEKEVGRMPLAWLKEAGANYQIIRQPAKTFLAVEPDSFFSVTSDIGCSLIRWTCLPPVHRYCRSFVGGSVKENELMHWTKSLCFFLFVNLPERRQWDLKAKTTFNVAAKKAVSYFFQSPNELFQSLMRDEELMMLCLELMLSAILVELNTCLADRFQQLEKVITFVMHLQAVQGAKRSDVCRVKAMHELLHNAKLECTKKKSSL